MNCCYWNLTKMMNLKSLSYYLRWSLDYCLNSDLSYYYSMKSCLTKNCLTNLKN